MSSRLMTEREVAEVYGLALGQLRALRFRGGGPAYHKLGSSVRYRVRDIEDWLEQRRRCSTSDARNGGRAKECRR